MGTNTYANGNEICSKSSSGKTIAAMPDPCFTPPPTPAGVEVVVPYPNTANASDLDKGSAKVLICNKMAALEKDSCLKTSMGNEAAKPSSMQGGVVTKTTKGKAFFTKWSDDVKFEGKGVCRHVDLTTHNHGSTPGHCVPMPFMSGMNPGGACKNEIKKIESECKATATTGEGKDKKVADSFKVSDTICKGLETLPTNAGSKEITITTTSGDYIDKVNSGSEDGKKMAQAAASMATVIDGNTCLQAMRCVLQEYNDTKNTPENAKSEEITCCKGQSGHHVLPRTMAKAACFNYENKNPAYSKAPVVCVEGVNNSHGTHGMIHRNLKRHLGDEKQITCEEMFTAAAQSLNNTFPNCDEGCVVSQLKDAAEKKDCNTCETNKTPFSAGPGLSGEVDEAVEGANINAKLKSK